MTATAMPLIYDDDAHCNNHGDLGLAQRNYGANCQPLLSKPFFHPHAQTLDPSAGHVVRHDAMLGCFPRGSLATKPFVENPSFRATSCTPEFKQVIDSLANLGAAASQSSGH